MGVIMQAVKWGPLAALCGTPMEPERFLPLALAITGALAELQGQNAIHKNINPYNILIHSLAGSVMLTGFSTDSAPPHGYPARTSPHRIETMPAGLDHRFGHWFKPRLEAVPVYPRSPVSFLLVSQADRCDLTDTGTNLLAFLQIAFLPVFSPGCLE